MIVFRGESNLTLGADATSYLLRNLVLQGAEANFYELGLTILFGCYNIPGTRFGHLGFPGDWQLRRERYDGSFEAPVFAARNGETKLLQMDTEQSESYSCKVFLSYLRSHQRALKQSNKSHNSLWVFLQIHQCILHVKYKDSFDHHRSLTRGKH